MGSLVAVGPAEQHASTTSWKWQDTNNTLASTFSRYKATVWSTNVYTSNPSNHALLRLENMRVRRINCGDC